MFSTVVLFVACVKFSSFLKLHNISLYVDSMHVCSVQFSLVAQSCMYVDAVNRTFHSSIYPGLLLLLNLL